MFVQVITAHAVEPNLLRAQLDRWRSELRPEAIGFLGATAGVTADGRFIATVRFEDEAAARVNSERAVQTSWWEQTERCLDGPAAFRESSDIELLGPGGSDNAGFVQMIQGRTADRTRFMALERELEPRFMAERRDFIGSLLAWWPDGAWLEVAYFTSDAETRESEGRGLSPGLSKLFSAWQQVASPSSYHDLNAPWLVS